MSNLHPYWGCGKLALHIHQSRLSGLQNRQLGADVGVRLPHCPFYMPYGIAPPLQIPFRPSHDTVNRVLKSFGFVRFPHDGAGVHRARTTTRWLQQRNDSFGGIGGRQTALT